MRELTCIRCPIGCTIAAEEKGGKLIITGNGCKRGEEYAREELIAPKRIVTCLLPLEGADEPLSVKTTCGVPKGRVFDVIRAIKANEMSAPVAIGTVIMENVLDSGADVVATKTVNRRA